MAKKQVEDGAQILDINFDEGMIGIHIEYLFTVICRGGVSIVHCWLHVCCRREARDVALREPAVVGARRGAPAVLPRLLQLRGDRSGPQVLTGCAIESCLRALIPLRVIQ